jgi:NitT/TauT family transport system permease protein
MSWAAATTTAPGRPVPAGEVRGRLAGWWRGATRTAVPFLVVGGIWEGVAQLRIFPPRLFPTLEEVASAFARLTISGILPRHAVETLGRLLLGFGLAAVVGVAVGIAMGRSRRAEDIFLPLVSIGAPIPGLAYAPLFILWFGLGNLPAVLLVGLVSTFPIIMNSWTGVKAVKEIWVRAAQGMGAEDRQLFRHVIVPGALPYILTGLRIGLAQAWRILVGVEMLLSVKWGLGWLIFGAREFLNTDVMLAGIVVIGIIGLALEKLVFLRLERYTVVPGGGVTTKNPPRPDHPHAHLMNPQRAGRRTLVRAVVTLAAVAAVYEGFARSGHFAQALAPSLITVAGTLIAMLRDGTMIWHAATTLYRVLAGFAIAACVGLPLGILMGRFRPVEQFFLPLISVLMPIPSLAWVPLFILWFGREIPPPFSSSSMPPPFP